MQRSIHPPDGMNAQWNFKKHVEDIAGRVRVRLAALAHTCKNEVSTETRVAIYKATIRPLIEYSCPAFIGAPRDIIQRLQIMQNHALTLCAGVRLMDRIPFKTIHETLKMPMLEDRLKMLATRFGNKAYSEVAPISQIIYSHRQLAECKYTPLAKFMAHACRFKTQMNFFHKRSVVTIAKLICL